MSYISLFKIIKDHWKGIIIVLIVLLMLPIVIASSFTVVSSVPAVDDDVISLYINVANKVGQNKTIIDWRDLIAIDSVRYKQNFKLANENNITKLAQSFIKENKKTTTYNFLKYKNLVSNINKKYNINLDWRNVVMADSVFLNSNFNNITDSHVNSTINKFIQINKIPETYYEYEEVKYEETYTEWEYWFDAFPWLGGRYVTKTRIVTKLEKVEKTRYVDGVEIKTLKDVLIDNGHSLKDIPPFFSNISSIAVSMKKIDITYSTKSLDTVIKEMGFSQEDKNSILRYKEVGLSMLIPSDGDNGSFHKSYKASEFINKVKNGAIETYKEYGVYPSISIAQAILESGYGGSGLTDKANNLFGIKADSGWNGAYVTMETSEYYGGIRVTVLAKFRAYNSWDESIEDHGLFLKENSRYTNNGVFSAKSYIEQAFALKKAGYATGPEYAYSLINIIQQYNLSEYDVL